MLDLYNNKENISVDGLTKDFLNKNEVTLSFLRDHYSASFINSWSECPAKTLVSNLPSNNIVPALEIGTAVHKLLEEKYSKDISNEELLDKANKLDIDPFFICEVKDYLRAYFKIKDYEEMSIKPTYLTEDEIICDVSPIGVELPVKIKGYVDRIDLTEKGTYIIDYKTASRKPHEDKYIDQMILYKWIVEEKYGVDVKGVYVASIFKQDPKYIKQNITLKKQSKLIDKIFSVDEEVVDSLKNNNSYIKRKGEHCRFCPIKDICDKEVSLKYISKDKKLDVI